MTAAADDSMGQLLRPPAGSGPAVLPTELRRAEALPAVGGEPKGKAKGKEEGKGNGKENREKVNGKEKEKAKARAKEDEDGDGKGKKGKRKLVLIVVAVLLLGVAGYMVKGRSHKTVYKPGQPVPAGVVTSLGTLTVNTSDGHLVQVGIDLQLTKVAVSKTVSTDMPQLRNAAISDLGDQTYPGLLAPTGRATLQQELLSSFQKVLGPVDGAAPQVSAVYFTGFVLQ